MVDTNSRYWFI